MGMILVLAVLFMDDTMYILDAMTTSFGYYLWYLPKISWETDAWARLGADHGWSRNGPGAEASVVIEGDNYGGPDGQGGDEGWMHSWTIFYWGWWISWAPFFEALYNNDDWDCGFSPTAGDVKSTRLEKSGFEAKHNQAYTLSYALTGYSWICLLLYFITSSDSGSFVIDILAANGDPDPPLFQRVLWAITEGAAATALLKGGGGDPDRGLKALQAVSVVSGLPFTIVLMYMSHALYIAVQEEVGDLDEFRPDFRTSCLELTWKTASRLADRVPFVYVWKILTKLDDDKTLVYTALAFLIFYFGVVLLLLAPMEANLRMIAGAFYMAFAAVVAYCRYSVRKKLGIATGDLMTDYCIAATGVSRCCWARIGSGEEELVVVRGRGFEVYGVVASTLQLRCAFSFEQRIHDLAPCRPWPAALVLSFGVFKPGAAASAPRAGGVETKPAGARADRTPPALAVARDGSSAAALVEGGWSSSRSCAARTRTPASAEALDRGGGGRAARFFDYAPGAGPATLIVVLGDARGDVPKSTRVAALGVDVAGRRVYPLWSVDGLPPVAQCLACTRDGGLVVVFRNSLAKIARGGAYEALALNGFADLDFSAESAGRHLLRANDEKLAVAVGGECAAAELVDDVVLLSLPGASTCWVLDGRRGRLHLRPHAAAPVASCVAYDPRRRRVFLGSFDGDGVLGDVGLAAAPNRRLSKKPKLDEDSRTRRMSCRRA
ncbi:BCCT, betaine/carnitine/choline family transporter [Aureococcus anophagefferens]|nr:BCCT, betaine/carnitine/choline family transporter [Aureococcus anophagefferens]